MSKTEERTKYKVSKRKETIQVQSQINEIENGNRIQKSNETKSWFFGWINKMGKPTTILIKKKRKNK